MAAASLLPTVPVRHAEFISYVKENEGKPLIELLEPYKQYDAKLREIFAQEPEHPALADPLLNVVPLYNGHQTDIKIHARDLNSETPEQKEKYIMALSPEERRPSGSPAIVQNIGEFQRNFALFSESSLVDLDWNNVVAAGSSVVTSLLPVPEKYNTSKKALRKYYHETIAPASDIDLFLYGLSEEEALKKIVQIESSIQNSILSETTTIRTKNAITIASQYPTRHVQIVLRMYKSISEILTGFDVDCSCAAYDGKAVYASPRAIVSYMTQCNTIDLTRRSPSYESRLSKYSHRGFEVHWPILDRSRIDPTVFERNFGRTVGLARLLVLERLPTSSDRESYMDQRRRERGRPAIDRYKRHAYGTRGNIKEGHEDEIAEWVVQEDVSDYHTFTIPYGPKYNAKNIEKLLYTKDLLLNAEWNKPKDREVNLHRHPAFFGRAQDVLIDCCGFCPEPVTPEEHDVAEAENKIYVSGKITFIKDDPGRQAIGSFNPITDDDWTEMAYVGNTARLCQAIIDCDLEHVEDWFGTDASSDDGDMSTIKDIGSPSSPSTGRDPNTRDYTGRTPLHLATVCSTPEIVQVLINHGARLVNRLADGRTALHLACERGNVEIVKMILQKSEANEEEEMKKEDARKRAKTEEQASLSQTKTNKMKKADISEDSCSEDNDLEIIDGKSDLDMRSTTSGSYVKIKPEEEIKDDVIPEDDDSEPDVYDVNVLAWDTQCSPLHLAILNGHTDVVQELVQTFGADALLPVKLLHTHGDRSPRGALLTLVLAMRLPLERAKAMTKTLLNIGASSAQGDMSQTTAVSYFAGDRPELLDILFEHDGPAAKGVINHLSVNGPSYGPWVQSPLMNAISNSNSLAALKLLDAGAHTGVDFKTWIRSIEQVHPDVVSRRDGDQNRKDFQSGLDQPIVLAVEAELPGVILELLSRGVDPNTLCKSGQRFLFDEYYRRWNIPQSLLDVVRTKIEALKEFKDEEPPVKPKTPFEVGANPLDGIAPGSYKFFVAQGQLQEAQKTYERDMKHYQVRLKDYHSRIGAEEKMNAVKALLKEFEEVETQLITLGAKTFKDLHPDLAIPPKHANWPGAQPEPWKPWKPSFGLKVYDITDETHEAYLKLFQAAWEGDLSTIKALTLSPGEDNTPLLIAVEDHNDHSPFSIAVLRGHLDTARAIIDISAAQYQPKDEEETKARYRVGDDDDRSSICSSEDVPVYKEVTSNKFTYENIGPVSTEARSSVTPLNFMDWICAAGKYAKFAGDGNKSGAQVPAEDGHDRPLSLFSWSIIRNDMEMFTLLLDLKLEWSDKLSTGDYALNDPFSYEEIDFAMRYGRIPMLAEMIKHTGAMLELESLVVTSGVKLEEKPKYYQGLSVYGKKRADWAAAAQGLMPERVTDTSPPLLQAARTGSLETVEWFMSDTPARHYKDFAEANKYEKHISHLNASAGGFDKVLSKWMGARRNLVIHCVIMGRQNPQTPRLLKYLIDAVPESLETRSSQGYTPLLLAFELRRLEAAKTLIAAGADQTARDRNGNNILHLFICSNAGYSDKSLTAESFFELIDKRLISSLLLERSSEGPGSATPLARYLSKYGATPNMLRCILKLGESTNNEQLEVIDGSGDTPLHQVAKNKEFFKIMLEYRPDLLYRENTVGRTPAELVEDEYIASCVRDPIHQRQCVTKLSIVHRHRTEFAKKESEEQNLDFVWEVREFMQKNPRKRKMVSLMEATEVAKRLATRFSHRRSYLGNGGDDESDVEEELSEDFQDEVFKWKP